MLTVTDILINAKKLLEERGWCQGRDVASDGAICLRGAIVYGTTGNFRFPSNTDPGYQPFLIVIRTISDAIDGLTGGREWYMVGWNDAPGRTKEQVLHLLDVAIQNTQTNKTSAPVVH